MKKLPTVTAGFKRRVTERGSCFYWPNLTVSRVDEI